MENLLQIWKNRNQIFEGIKNNIFKKEHVELIANSRNGICNECEFIDPDGESCAVIGTQPCCSQCGCSLRIKTRSLSSSCPKGFWKAVLSEEEETALNNNIK